jgi:hypothetical protein
MEGDDPKKIARQFALRRTTIPLSLTRLIAKFDIIGRLSL